MLSPGLEKYLPFNGFSCRPPKPECCVFSCPFYRRKSPRPREVRIQSSACAPSCMSHNYGPGPVPQKTSSFHHILPEKLSPCVQTTQSLCFAPKLTNETLGDRSCGQLCTHHPNASYSLSRSVSRHSGRTLLSVVPNYLYFTRYQASVWYVKTSGFGHCYLGAHRRAKITEKSAVPKSKERLLL